MINVKLGNIKDEDRKAFVKCVIDYNFYGMLEDDEAQTAVDFIINAEHLVDARLKLHEMINIAYTRDAISYEDAESKEKQMRSERRKQLAAKKLAVA